MPSFPLGRAIGAAALLTALCGCGFAGDDEIQAETAAILTRVPVGTPFKEQPGAMQELGFSCTMERRQFTDAKGRVRETEPHFSCAREQSRWLVCARRTRAVLIQLNGRLSNVLVNVGYFCT